MIRCDVQKKDVFFRFDSESLGRRRGSGVNYVTTFFSAYDHK